MSEKLQDEVAVITGASSGIGWATALRLASAKMKVVLIARRTERLEELAKQIHDQGGVALTLPTDLKDTNAIEKTFQIIRNTWGGTRVLINNAGLGFSAPLVSGETAKWEEMLQVNILALCVATREATTDMQKSGAWGHVLHVSSMAGHRVPEGSGVYSATKYAVRSLTEGLRKELRTLNSKVRVSAVSPGFVETEFAAHYHGSSQAAVDTYQQYPVIQPSEVAELIWTILSQPEHVQIHDVLLRPTAQLS